MNFTDKSLSALKPEDKLYFVREARGFTVRVMPSGFKTFLYIYEMKGKKVHLNLGVYPQTSVAEARQLYTAAYLKVASGIDPKQESIKVVEKAKEDNSLTFGHFAELFLVWSKANYCTSWHRTNELSLKHDVLPYWKDTKIEDIRRRDAIALIERVAARSAGQAANVQKAARSVFDYALQREFTDNNPMLRLVKVIPALKVTSRERTLSDKELKQLWYSIDAGPGDSKTKRALKLILVTAQRPGEVAGMRHEEIEGEWWTIPSERAEKGRGEHLVYLTPTALQLIGSGKGFVFPSPRPKKPLGRNSLAQLVSSPTAGKEPYYGLPRWTPHDFRRTARTNMARAGVVDEHAEAVLAHCKQGVKKVYNKYEYKEEKKAALLTWEELLLSIINPVCPVVL